MPRDLSFLKKCLLFLGMGTIVLTSLAASRLERDIDVTAKTTISGIVNGSPMTVDVLATFNTGRGGSSTCKFTKLPAGFTPASLGTHAWTTHHSSAGLSRFEGDPVVNLYDLTKGNYRVLRMISYPEFPESQIITEAQVKAAKKSEWKTNITISGTYNGPTDIVSVKDYHLTWTAKGKNILESGSATLVSSSGKSVLQVWSSMITMEHGFDKFPQAGELITISISPFQIDGNSMSYKWEGTVKARSK